MVPITNLTVPRPETPPPPPQNTEEKNVDTLQSKQMDSTPIADIMNQAEGMMEGNFPADPRSMMMPPRMMTQQMPAPMMAVPQKPSKGSPGSVYPMNLTAEQMEALVVGIVAVVAFSKQVQGKLSDVVPNFLNSEGDQTTTGMLVTALVAALLFYLSRKFFLKKEDTN